MPVSVVCEIASNNVSAALHEKLSRAVVAFKSAEKGAGGSSSFYGNHLGNTTKDTSDRDNFQNALAASAKSSTVDKVDYAEISFSKSLDELKTKYIVLNKVASGAATLQNGYSSDKGIVRPSLTNGGSITKTLNGKSKNTMEGTSSTATDNSSCNTSTSLSAASATTSNNIINNSNNNNNNHTPTKRNQHELAKPKVVLYPREKIRIGWKNSLRKWQVGAGFVNVGNTCYLNSTLQALLHVPSMANWLASEYEEQHMDNCPESEVGCTICAMIRTLEAAQASVTAVRPHHIFSRLKSICKQMVVGRQEDAHEFLRYLVDSMEKSYLSRFRNQHLDHSSRETTPLNQIFGGYLRSAVRCLHCEHVSVTFQHFQDLSLDIGKVDSIEQALDQFFSRERLEDMCYKCESCKRKVCASKQFSLERAPITLCIQLKRFNPTGIKLGKTISMKTQLNLNKYATQKPNNGEQLTYKLVAMVTHLGQSPNCGHYTAIGLTESGTYYNFDDSFVRSLSVNTITTTNAYIIFYEMDQDLAKKQSCQTVATETILGNAAITTTNEKSLAISTNNYVGRITLPSVYNSSPKQLNGTRDLMRIIGPEYPTTTTTSLMSSLSSSATETTTTTTRTNATSSPSRKTELPNYFTYNKYATNGSVNSKNINKPLSILNGNESNTINNNIKNILPNTNNSKTIIHFKTANAYNSNGPSTSQGINAEKTTCPSPKFDLYSKKNENNDMDEEHIDNDSDSNDVENNESNNTANVSADNGDNNNNKKNIINNKNALKNVPESNKNNNDNYSSKEKLLPDMPLVPYDLETDEETSIDTPALQQQSSQQQQKKVQGFSLKRRREDTALNDSTLKPKNLKNPFARNVEPTTSNDNNNNCNGSGNGKNATETLNPTNGIVQSIIQQSHRGLGGLVKTWDGGVSSIDLQVNNEKKEQRQREWEEDEENEMDRGRQKKVNNSNGKSTVNRYYNITPGYNPFQEQENARRWRNPRFFTTHYNRHHYQRNKFKFQRISNNNINNNTNNNNSNNNNNNNNNSNGNIISKFQRSNNSPTLSNAAYLLRQTSGLIKPVNKNNLLSINNNTNRNYNSNTNGSSSSATNAGEKQSQSQINNNNNNNNSNNNNGSNGHNS